MTRKILKTLTASLVAATIGSAVLAGPAAAGGSISLTYAPTNAQDAQALQTGLAIYSLFQGIQSGADITQLGLNNMAGIAQNGVGNNGVIYQEGNGHTGTLSQNGNNNSCGIFQFGQNTQTNIVQNGDNGACANVTFGW